MSLTKESLLRSLPVCSGDLTLRGWTRDDVDLLAEWPSYPPAYEAFNMSVRGKPASERDAYYASRGTDPDKMILVLDRIAQRAIGYISLSGINWETREMQTMGVRIHPDWCDKQIGTHAMLLVGDWGLRAGLECLRLDVAGPNLRAIRCYEKAHFSIAGEFWREAADLCDKNLDLPEHASLKPHVRYRDEMPEVRFLWMERHG